MSDLTNRLHKTIKTFTEARSAARAKYLRTEADLEDKKGSKYYQDKINAAAAERAAVVEGARRTCSAELKEIFTAMHEANRKRQLPPPTEDQLRLLQALDMRENITADELTAAANTLDGNAAAMALLHEIAKKNHIGHDYSADARHFTISTADAEIDRVARECRQVLESSAKPAPRYAARMNRDHYGAPYNEDLLPQLPTFDTESDFAAFMGYGDRLREAVNG